MVVKAERRVETLSGCFVRKRKRQNRDASNRRAVRQQCRGRLHKGGEVDTQEIVQSCTICTTHSSEPCKSRKRNQKLKVINHRQALSRNHVGVYNTAPAPTSTSMQARWRASGTLAPVGVCTADEAGVECFDCNAEAGSEAVTGATDCAASTPCAGEAEVEPGAPASGSTRSEGGSAGGSSWPSSFRRIRCSAMLNSCLPSFPFAS